MSSLSLLMVKTSQSAEVELMEWGLIPHWCKTEAQAKQLSEMTFNARSESIFEKPAFRDAARSHRCLVAIDGYYEYLHLNQRKYPFFVQLKTGPMVLAGLWSEWVSPETGEIKRTHTLVTTEANALLKQVHNTKQRMPVVLSEEGQEQWMDPSISAEALFRPFPSNAFHVHSTPPILGYKGVGDSPEASSHFEYPELTFTYADLAEVSESRD